MVRQSHRATDNPSTLLPKRTCREEVFAMSEGGRRRKVYISCCIRKRVRLTYIRVYTTVFYFLTPGLPTSFVLVRVNESRSTPSVLL